MGYPPMLRFIPRTIRWQLILGTALLQCLLVAGVFSYVYYQQRSILRTHTAERLTYQVHLLSHTAALELRNHNQANLQPILEEMLQAPTIQAARITELSGRTVAYSSRVGSAKTPPLSATERRQLSRFPRSEIFDNGDEGLVGVADVTVDGIPVARVWVYPDTSEDAVDLATLMHSAFLFALLAIVINALFSLLLARSVTLPLQGLLRGTKLLIRDPARSDVFPLKTQSVNEAGELTRAFNTMVAALNEQRAGLNDTLALLDSMLAHAPIGFAFFDRKTRYVRVNQFLAEMDTLPVNLHLGRAVEEIFHGPMGRQLSAAIEEVFSTGTPARELEMNFELPSIENSARTWIVSLYPVRIEGENSVAHRPGADTTKNEQPQSPKDHIRWVGAVVVDATERKISEKMLRRTEKLAATGRLAASIAHEINNPLEAVTNLLFLLHQQPLDPEALQYADMAQQEIARISLITQQTLRFYRQSSKPIAIHPGELLDSVVNLHQGRLYSSKVEVERRYAAGSEMVAFSGEMRQIFANLVGNALDAMPKGGRLVLSVRPSQAWDRSDVDGVRIVVADTGQGMSEAVRRRIFEAFFTTKEATGTGLGLWISSGIIAKHKGTVRVRSRVAEVPTAEGPAKVRNSGTVFMLFFPRDSDVARNWTEHGNQDYEVHEEAEA